MMRYKQYKSPQVAHLYEHLFCLSVESFFRSRDLFPWLDYTFNAHTLLPGGIICIDIRLHTEQAQELTNEVALLGANLDDRFINTAIVQLVTEEGRQLGTDGIEKIRKELKEVDAQPWCNIDDLDQIDPTTLPQQHGAIYLLPDAKKIPPQKLKVSIVLNQEFANTHKALLPLFWVLSKVIAESIKVVNCLEFGCYSMEIRRTFTRHSTALSYQFHAINTLPMNMELAAKAIDAALDHLGTTGAYSRYIVELRKTSVDVPHRPMLDPIILFKYSSTLTGAKGWQAIATDENCDLVLANMKVKIRLNNRQLTIAV